MQPFLILSALNNFGVSGADLRGCVNDIRGKWEFAKKLAQMAFGVGKYGFKNDGYCLWDSMATAERIKLAVADAITKGKKDDFLEWHHSGHASTDGDDVYICGYQFNWSRKQETFISGRQITAMLKKAVDKGMKVVFTLDACNSGNAIGRDIKGPPRDMRFKAVPAPYTFTNFTGYTVEKAIKDEKLGIVYISGCGPKATDYSADVVGSDGRAYGAMSKYQLSAYNKAIEGGTKATYRAAVRMMNIELEANQFEQRPEIHGGDGPLTPDDYIYQE